jgi:hypothetical protein
MKIENLFERDIYRPINGVVKADQLDDASRLLEGSKMRQSWKC